MRSGALSALQRRLQLLEDRLAAPADDPARSATMGAIFEVLVAHYPDEWTKVPPYHVSMGSKVADAARRLLNGEATAADEAAVAALPSGDIDRHFQCTAREIFITVATVVDEY